MQDEFAGHAVGLTSPASQAESISPSDSTELAHATRGLYVGQTGNVRAKTVTGEIVMFANMQGGLLYPVRIVQVMATGTTATDLVGLS